MTMTNDGLAATRRLIIKGVASVALVGLGQLPFSVSRALAAANDKYPEDAFKQKSEADAIKALYGKNPEPSDKVKLDAPGAYMVEDHHIARLEKGAWAHFVVDGPEAPDVFAAVRQ